MSKFVFYAVAAAGIAACTPTYMYTPMNANSAVKGAPASKTNIPQEKPQGAVEVASFGTTNLTRENEKIPVIHIRMVVTNDGDPVPWTINVHEQLLSIPEQGKARPLYARADVNTLPVITVARGDKRILDLYYPLGPNVDTNEKLGDFDLLWNVHTDARMVSSRTSFDRVEVEPDIAYGWGWWGGSPYAWGGWGPYWWYDPFYPRGLVGYRW